MKKKLRILGKYIYKHKNKQPQLLTLMIEEKIQELMKYEKYRKKGMMFFSVLFGYILRCLVN